MRLMQKSEAEIKQIKVYLVSHGTLRSYAEACGWEKIRELFKVMRVGIKFYDEAHQNFDNMMMVDFFSDVEVVRGDRGKNLMLAFLIDSKEMNNTVATLNWLEATLGADAFREMFPVILTDNGCEFADPELFETGKDGQRRTRLYYCEPRHSEQKGALEKNHEYIRYVLPKGTSFDELTQEKVLLMVNHINNTTRPKLHGSTPMKKVLKSFDN